jgi:putative phosphoesterase
MRVAALYDIHGNLPALEAVLREVRAFDVDLIVVGGDVMPGPMPRQCLSLLEDLDVPTAFICGNGDRAVRESSLGQTPLEVPDGFRPSIAWNAEQLSDAHLRSIASWPLSRRMRIVGLGEVLFCHATPRSDTELFTKLTPDERLKPAFAKIGDVSVVVCGHTHMPFDRRLGELRVVNAGSVGAPFCAPGAYWLLLGPGIQFRHTQYDFAAAADLIRGSGYPQADDFASNNILTTPSEEQMLAAFTAASTQHPAPST